MGKNVAETSMIAREYFDDGRTTTEIENKGGKNG